MAYPFIQWPTLDEFIEKTTTEYGAELKTASSSPSGKYLVRTVSGQKKVAYLPNIQGKDRLSPTVLRSLCDQLSIPLKDFGLIFG